MKMSQNNSMRKIRWRLRGDKSLFPLNLRSKGDLVKEKVLKHIARGKYYDTG